MTHLMREVEEFSPFKLTDLHIDKVPWRNPSSDAPECQLDEIIRSLCECTWHRYEGDDGVSIRIQHGENPEHSLLILEDGYTLVVCSRAHDFALCSWAAEVVSRVHRR